jgi:hypothetical protein
MDAATMEAIARELERYVAHARVYTRIDRLTGKPMLDPQFVRDLASTAAHYRTVVASGR